MNTINLIETTEDLNAMLEASQEKPVLLLKHSNSCPISSAGHNQFMQLQDEDNLDMYMVVVQTARATSMEIADRLSVTHQSPQVIIIDKGEAKANMSHYNIKSDAVLNAYTSISNP